MMWRALATVLVLGLGACGPIPLPEAERACINDAQLAQRPRGSIAFGIGSGGYSGAAVELGVSSDYLLHRDPDQVYAACVQRRSGQAPTRPYSTLPESRM